LTEFAKIFLFIIAGGLFVCLGYALNYFLAPSKPNPEKNSTYECGEESIGGGEVQFNLRFYLIGLIFLIFDVEILFLFPWATVYAKKEFLMHAPEWGIYALAEGILFVGILALGLAYVWKKGDLEWELPETTPIKIDTGIPDERYEAVNARYS